MKVRRLSCMSVNRLFLILPLIIAGCGTSAKTLHVVAVTGRYRFIDHSGRMVIPPQFEQATEFAEDLAAVQLNGRWGYIDSKGRLGIAPQFDLADPFSDG